MARNKLILVTGLLTLLLYNGYGLYTSIVVFSITVITTYLCYTLNTQLRLDGFFRFLVYFGIGGRRNAISSDEKDSGSAEITLDGLKVLPKPIEQIIQKFIDSIIQDFIKSWYLFIGPDEEDFINEVVITLQYFVTKLYLHLDKVDVNRVVINLIKMFQRHIKLFDDCRNIVHSKYPGISESDFSDCITELYEAGIIKHIATKSKGTEFDYLKTLIDVILHEYVPRASFSCESGRFMLREILATQLLEPLVTLFADPHFVNEAVFDILEPSMPLSDIIEMYENAMNDNKNISSEELSDIEDDFSGNETTYESTHEDIKSTDISSESTLIQLTTPQNNSLKGDSSSRSKSDKELLRFDNLDRSRTSAPVYGSRSARDHEKKSKSKHIKSKRSVPASVLTPELDQNLSKTVLINSGRASRRCVSLNESKSFSSSDTQLNIIKRDYITSSWNDCPPATSEVFLKTSFEEMPRNQDNLAEQLKAKVRMISLPASCINSCTVPRRNHRQLSKSSSLDGSVTMDFSKKLNDVHDLVADSSSIATDSSSRDIVKIHGSGTNGAFYELAPSCPTCIEMTLLASPFENDRAKLIMTEKEANCEQHQCGLNEEHYFCAEIENESTIYGHFDDQSFESCADDINGLSESYSSGTLLASGETFESSGNHDGKDMETYDILSLLSEHSDTDSENSPTSSLSYDDIETNSLAEEIEVSRFRERKQKHKTPSVATFKTAIEESTKLDKGDVSSKSPSPLKQDLYSNQIFKFFKRGLSFTGKKLKKSSSLMKAEKSLKKHRLNLKLNAPKRKQAKKPSNSKKILIPNQHETSSISTSITKFNSIPDSSLSPLNNLNNQESLVGSYIEEVGSEVEEDDDCLAGIAPSQVGNISIHEFIPVDPLSKVIAVTDKELPMESRSVKSSKSIKSSASSEKLKSNIKPAGLQDALFIPIYEGEVIMPHPSKLPAAWLYPIQMISIPSTEVAYEKGWEPGINKYTLYNIHYDIRIWPDLYHKQVLNMEMKAQSDAKDTIPVIREIKRRYREFLYLHNRLTHGHMSKHMKGILRPNRRYAMPFGRMDPDVIEGRRKILETYLVSLVSRLELCNSREFKDFLGSEGNEDSIEIKQQSIRQKQIYKQKVNRIITTSDSSDRFQQVHKEHVERIHGGLSSQYFIHGYEIPRMFGYANQDELRRHSMYVISYFVDKYDTLKDVKEKKLHHSNVYASFEPIQKPHFYIPDEYNEMFKPPGLRTAGDGAEIPEQFNAESRIVTFEDSAKKYDGNVLDDETPHSIHIAAKFSEELADQLQKDRENLASEIAHEKDLYESSWPLTDAVLAIFSQALKSCGSWITYERVQQAVLFSLGGVIEWLISRELNEVTMKERCYKYLNDLYNVVWDKEGKLIEKDLEPTVEEREHAHKKALQKIMDTIPSFVMMSVGPSNYKNCCKDLLHTLQYERINRHVLYAALEIIMIELIPELQSSYGYVETATTMTDSS